MFRQNKTAQWLKLKSDEKMQSVANLQAKAMKRLRAVELDGVK